MAPKAEQKKGDEQERVPLSALDPQQLVRLRQDIEMDVQRLSEYGTNMQKIKPTLASAKNSVETLAQSTSGQPILLPLTSSLYVNGEVDASDSVLVDIGTGYYVEMSCDDAVKYHERRIGKLDGSMNTIMQNLQTKQSQLLEINAVLNDKMQAAQAAQAAQVAKG